MRWTSLEAYWSIYPDLPVRRQETLKMLVEIVAAGNRVPTGQEVERFARSRGLTAVGQPNRFKRLSELADLSNAVHRTDARPCDVTGNMAMTWTPGPIPGTELGEPPPDAAIRRRLHRLRFVAPLVTFEDSLFILNVTNKKLASVWTDDDNGGGNSEQKDFFE